VARPDGAGCSPKKSLSREWEFSLPGNEAESGWSLRQILKASTAGLSAATSASARGSGAGLFLNWSNLSDAGSSSPTFGKDELDPRVMPGNRRPGSVFRDVRGRRILARRWAPDPDTKPVGTESPWRRRLTFVSKFRHKTVRHPGCSLTFARRDQKYRP